MRILPGLIVFLLLAPAGAVRAQQFVYIWNGPVFSSTSGTVAPGSSVSGSLVIQGPIENLPFEEVTPVSFSFSAGPVTIDDSTPLHPLTVIKLQTDAGGEIIATEIQLVEAIETPGGTTFADVICVAQCPAFGPSDGVIDRDATANLIGDGEAAVTVSHWFSPQPLGPPAPALPLWARLGLLGAVAAVGGLWLRKP